MYVFNIIAGIASIASLIISLVTFRNVIIIKESIIYDNSISSKQSVKSKDITDSEVKQAGRDINELPRS